MFKFSDKILAAAEKATEIARPIFAEIEKNSAYNQEKMLKAFLDARVSATHFAGSTGYGYDDRGRDVLDTVYASAFGAESALVRHFFASGTHALTVSLFGVLRPGDRVLCVTGTPYDTILGVIGLQEYPVPRGKGMGSLRDFGIEFEVLPLTSDGNVDFPALESHLDNSIRMVYIQRSRGYTLRPSLSIEKIETIASFCHKRTKDVVIMVDNCYGEFVERLEPVQVGADLMAGSLIKNPGGGLASSGGYIAGRHDLVELCSYRLTTPGTGREIGCTTSHLRELFLGAFHAPHAVGEALKTAIFAAALLRELDYTVSPTPEEFRTDIIQSVIIGDETGLIRFCRGLQSHSPIDSFVSPEPADMPGYDNQVIMAAGTFTLGASIELSADAPLREPYAVWLQGGLNSLPAKVGVMAACEELTKN